MIIDTSAVVALVNREAHGPYVRDRLAEAAELGIGAPTLLETRMVLSGRHGPAGSSLVTRFIGEFGVGVVDFTDRHASVATEAFLRFGKGRHPAALNYGDCMAYATARLARRPLLCLGDDFARTDLDLVPVRPGTAPPA